MSIRWKACVDEHDYAAAYRYLTILLDADRAKLAVDALKQAKPTIRRANDILRGTNREPLARTDPGVAKSLKRIKQRKLLSPILVVSFEHGGDIADGYHRVSATYLLDPFADVPLKLAHVPELSPLRSHTTASLPIALVGWLRAGGWKRAAGPGISRRP